MGVGADAWPADNRHVIKRTILALLALLLVVSPVRAVDDGDLRVVASARVVFGHQSVGWNIIDAMRATYQDRNVGLLVVDGSENLPAAGGGFAQVEIGVNGDPASKFDAFAAAVSDGVAVEVAAMKLCFVDITSGTDVPAVFRQYTSMVNALQASHPQTALMHFTVPLTVDDPASNLKRQRYNSLMRRRYGSALVDLARIESTRPNGSRVAGRWRGHRYYALFRGYAADEGHLNGRGANRVAAAFVVTLAAHAVR